MRPPRTGFNKFRADGSVASRSADRRPGPLASGRKRAMRLSSLEALEARTLLSGSAIEPEEWIGGEANGPESTSVNQVRDTVAILSTGATDDLSGATLPRATAILAAVGSRSPQPLNPLDITGDSRDKPQSKLWIHDGKWWTVFSTNEGTFLFRLDDQTWASVLKLSDSMSIHADARAIGNLTHILLFEETASHLASVEYVPGAPGTYRLWQQRPTLTPISLGTGVESATIDVDTTGRMWLASDANSDAEVRFSDAPYSSFSAPIVLTSNLSSDDICAVTAISDGTIGVMCSSQVIDRFVFRYHVDGADATAWSAVELVGDETAQRFGRGVADDHINLAVTSDGTLFAAIKTSYLSLSIPHIGLYVRRPTGDWEPLVGVDNGGTRPIVVVNETDDRLLMIYTSSDFDGDIVYKESFASNIEFGSRVTLITGDDYNNPSSTKQNFTNELVVVASKIEHLVGSIIPPVGAGGGGGPVFIPVDAGADQTAILPAGIMLHGTTTDGLTSSWVAVSAPGVVRFDNATAAETAASFSLPGSYVLRFIATDGENVGSDDVTVTVVQNQPPQVNAGPDVNIAANAAALLDATVTDDGLPNPPNAVTVLWTKLSGPGDVFFANASAVDTTATTSEPGSYVLKLAANDSVSTAFDTVTVHVGNNQPPQVDAGFPQIVVIPSVARLTGTVTDDGLLNPPGMVTIAWSKLSGPGSVSFGDTSAEVTNAAFGAPGTYVLRLTANDGGFTVTDDVTITVVDASSIVAANFQDGVGPTTEYFGTRDTSAPLDPVRTRGARSARGSQLRVSSESSGLVSWDISAIPPGTLIRSASITVNVSDESLDRFEIYDLKRNWLEQPPRGAEIADWEIDGAQGPTDRGSIVLGTVGPTVRGLVTIELNGAGVAMVQSWVNNPASNFGFVFQDYNTVDPLSFSSRETRRADQRPLLQVTMVNTPPVVNAGADQNLVFPALAPLDGTAADDGLPVAPGKLRITWEMISGPGVVTFGDFRSLNTTASFSLPGTYVLRLRANDGSFHVTDDVRVSVLGLVSRSFQDEELPTPTYTGTRDTRLESVLQNTNFGEDGDLKTDGSPPTTALIKWDITSIPLGSTVQTASITLDVVNGSTDIYNVFGMARDWDESQANWVRPKAGEQWEEAGAFGQTDRNPTILGSISNVVETKVTVELNAAGIALVQQWVNDPTRNFGISIQGDPSESDGLTFNSSETSTDGNRPMLTVTYAGIQGTGNNLEPVVDAGPDQTANVGSSLNLNARVRDDDLPPPPAAVTNLWTKVSGPGTVTFGDATQEDTSVRFGTTGVYVLRLTANDSELTAFDEVTVTVGLSESFQNGVQPTNSYAGMEDTRISSIEPGVNFGGASSLMMDGPALTGLIGTVMRWDISSIPFGSLVQKATITLNVTNGTADLYEIYAVKRNWSESEATWNQFRSGSPWQTAGGTGENDIDPTVLGTVTAAAIGSLKIDLNAAGIAVVQSWINNPETNFGFLIQDYAGSTDQIQFSSSEFATAASRPKLTISYNEDPTPRENSPPLVNSGTDQAVLVGTPANLDATVRDDGRPNPPRRVTTTWSMVTGPGSVTFGSASAIDTTAQFTVPGVYVLRLTARDGELTSTDDVNIAVTTSALFQDGIFPTAGYAGTRDTRLESTLPNTNFGGGREVGADGPVALSAATGLIEWDIRTIPVGAVVQGASITLDIKNTSPDTFEVYAMRRDWREGEATWRGSSTNSTWQSAGAQGLNDRGNTVIGSITPNAFGPTTIELNEAGVALVQSWVDNQATNFGIIIQDYSQSDDRMDFGSRESAVASLRPKLNVRYFTDATPRDNQPPTVNAGADQDVILRTGAALFGTARDDLLPNPPRAVTSIWGKESGPGAVTFENARSPQTTAFFSSPGVYVLRLSATDSVFTASDTVTVRVTGLDTFQDGVSPDPTYFGTQDTYIDSLLPNTHFGTGGELSMDSSPAQAALIRWDLSAIDPGVRVTSAKITLNITNSSTDRFDVYALKRSFDETGANWRVSELGRPWQVAGAGGANDRSDVVLGSISGNVGPVTINLEEDGLATVMSWINDPLSNFGIIIRSASGNDALQLSSSDAESPANRPKLAIEYENDPTPLVNRPPVVSAGPDVETIQTAAATLNGTVQDDRRPNPPGRFTANWSVVGGPGTVRFGNPSGVDTVARFSTTGVYVLRLTATDSEFSVSDDVTVVVTAGESFQNGVFPTDAYFGSRDAALVAGTPTTPAGSATTLTLDGTPDLGVLMKWDISSLPDGASIQSATITINVTNSTSDSYSIYESKQDWVEAEATWNQFRASNPWEIAGAQGPDDRSNTPIGFVVNAGVGAVTINLNAAGVALVQSWFDNATANYGVVIQNYTGAGDNVIFSSRETATATQRPKLSVNYAVSESPGVIGATAAAREGLDESSNDELAGQDVPRRDKSDQHPHGDDSSESDAVRKGGKSVALIDELLVSRLPFTVDPASESHLSDLNWVDELLQQYDDGTDTDDLDTTFDSMDLFGFLGGLEA